MWEDIFFLMQIPFDGVCVWHILRVRCVWVYAPLLCVITEQSKQCTLNISFVTVDDMPPKNNNNWTIWCWPKIEVRFSSSMWVLTVRIRVDEAKIVSVRWVNGKLVPKVNHSLCSSRFFKSYLSFSEFQSFSIWKLLSTDLSPFTSTLLLSGFSLGQ